VMLYLENHFVLSINGENKGWGGLLMYKSIDGDLVGVVVGDARFLKTGHVSIT
ncbi:hypothetical protein L195_g063926, partial [Trifolium pratense]